MNKLPYAQLRIRFQNGKLADDPAVVLNGEEIARIPCASVEMVANAQTLIWRIETIAEPADDGPLRQFTTLDLSSLPMRH